MQSPLKQAVNKVSVYRITGIKGMYIASNKVRYLNLTLKIDRTPIKYENNKAGVVKGQLLAIESFQ
jgi:hypothetical protein